jgi:hypothetical protein
MPRTSRRISMKEAVNLYKLPSHTSPLMDSDSVLLQPPTIYIFNHIIAAHAHFYILLLEFSDYSFFFPFHFPPLRPQKRGNASGKWSSRLRRDYGQSSFMYARKNEHRRKMDLRALQIPWDVFRFRRLSSHYCLSSVNID